jgi:RNA polymerase sigma-70 factor (ECF subfamily)
LIDFEEVFRIYYPRVYAFLYKLCSDRNIAEELAQETFFQAFKSFRRFRGDSNIFTWLAAIAKRVYYRFLKQNRLKSESVANLDVLTDAYCASMENNPEVLFARNEITQTVRKIIKKIPQKYQDVVILRIYAALPFAEIAAIMHISENSAKVIYFRAKKLLMEELKHEYKL